MTMGDDFRAEAARTGRAAAASFSGRMLDAEQLVSFQADPTPRPCGDCLSDGECGPTCGRGID